MFLVDWIISIVMWIYDFVLGVTMWIFNGMLYMATDPEAFFAKYGIIILIIVLLVLTIISIMNWVFKRYLFQMTFMCPPDKPRNTRYIGRKLFFLKKGGFFYKLKVPEDHWDEFEGLLYFVYPKVIWKIPVGFSADRVLIPKDENREYTWKYRGGFRWKKDFVIYYKGMKEYHKLASKIATDKNKATTISVGANFFTKAGQIKLDLADKLAQKGVTSNAESQQYQLALGSVPYNQEFIEMSDREIVSTHLKRKEDIDIDPEDLEQEKVDEVMAQLEGGLDD